MSLTININGLTLCHKGSNGISQNTLPDVCKTPPYSVPIPYPNVAFSKDLVQGTHSVSADGGNMIAHNQSNFASSIMDEPGSSGGIVSNVNRSKAEWISHSFDIFFEGNPACRLTDKMFMNKKNTVNMGGLMQAPLENWPELMVICTIICFCDKNPRIGANGQELKQQCVNRHFKLIKQNVDNFKEVGLPVEFAKFINTAHHEIPYDMTKNPPSPLLNRRLLSQGLIKSSEFLYGRMKIEGLESAKENGGIYQVRTPDVSLTRPISQKDLKDLRNDDERTALFRRRLKGVVEIKFDQAWDSQQLEDYAKIVGNDKNRLTELSPKECECKTEDNDERMWALTKKRIEQGSEMAWEDIKKSLSEFYDKMGEITGLTGAALIIFIIISEVSRAYPPRNLVPVP